MKRLTAFLLVLVLALSLAACNQEPSPTTVPTTETTTIPTTEPTTELPTEPPTEPPIPETPWLTNAPENLSYEDYFSEVRIFSYIAGTYSTIWNVNDDGTPSILYSGQPTDNAYYLELDQHGLRILSYDTQSTLWSVPGSETLTGLDCCITDGHYAYCIRDQKELLRMELLTGETTLLATADCFPVDNYNCISLHNQEVLLFLTQTDERIAINRLYLPDMVLDVLYDGIPSDPFLCQFNLSYEDTDALLWHVFDPAFLSRLMDVLSDPDSDYQKYATSPKSLWGAENLEKIVAHRDFITIVQIMEMKEEIPSLLSCYLDIPSGTCEEEPSYWCPDMQEPRGYQDRSLWTGLYMRFSDPEAEPVTDQELADAFDKSPFSFIHTLSEDGPWNDSREDIVRQLVAAKADDAAALIETLENELTYYRTAASKAQPVAQLTQHILDLILQQNAI